jgi:DUF4097 and DUF4098 domain-containing protein YvlB
MTSKTSRWGGAWLLAGLMTVAPSAFAGAQYEQNLDKTFTVTPGSQLVISADMGPIHVITGPADKLEIHVLRKVTGGAKEAADELFSRHEVTFTQTGNTVSVVAKNKIQNGWSWRSGQQNLEVRYEVIAPAKFNLDLKTAGGDITLEDLDGKLDARTSSGAIRAGSITGSFSARNAGGDISVKEVGQDATASTSSGSIGIEKAGGDVDASDAGGNIRIGESVGKIDAHTSSGSIAIGSAGGDVAARDAGGDIRVKVAKGNVNVDTSSGLIKIGAAMGESLKAENHGGNVEIGEAGGAVEVGTSSGSIQINRAAGSVEARDAGGNISIDTVQKTADVRTSSGSIRIGTAQGRVNARDAGGSIEIAEAGGAVDAETSSGTINVSFLTAPRENCRLLVSGGGINASVPADASLNVDAESMGGSVESELPLTIQGKTRNSALNGQLNGGGPKLSMRSSSGNIRLKRSSGSPIENRAEANH